MLLLYFIKPDLGQFFESRLTGQRIIQTLINRHEIRGCGDVGPGNRGSKSLGDATFFLLSCTYGKTNDKSKFPRVKVGRILHL